MRSWHGRAYLAGPAISGLIFCSPALAASPCQGPGAPTNTQTKCVTAVQIPGNPLRSFDISFVNLDRGEYYLADRSNAGIDIIDTNSNMFKANLPAFLALPLVPH